MDDESEATHLMIISRSAPHGEAASTGIEELEAEEGNVLAVC